MPIASQIEQDFVHVLSNILHELSLYPKAIILFCHFSLVSQPEGATCLITPLALCLSHTVLQPRTGLSPLCPYLFNSSILCE